MTEPTTAAGPLDVLWAALWDDLRHNATGKPTGEAIIERHRAAIEAEATEAAMLAAFDDVQAIDRAEARQPDASALREALTQLLVAAQHQRDVSPGAVPQLLEAITVANEALASGSFSDCVSGRFLYQPGSHCGCFEMSNRHTHAGDFRSCYESHTPQPDENVSPRTEAGRDAVEWHRYLHAEGILVTDEGEECGPWHHRVFLGLAVEREASSPALDVERIREASRLHRKAESAAWAAKGEYHVTHVCGDGDCWDKIAAEYARLSTPEPER